MNRVLYIIGITILLALVSYAQLTRGAIVGTIIDSNGGVVAGVRITITNMDTNISRDTVSNDAGLYRISALEPGRYSIKVEQKGFETLQIADVIVRTSQETTYNPTLKVGNVSVSVEISGTQESGISLNKTNPTIGLTATDRQATELPLSAARNINNLALLSPNIFQAPGSTGISSNGQRARNNNFTIDGSDNNDISVTLMTTPVVPEAVAEFQVQTNAYNVEFGRNSGAQLNVITKSGTNKIHGDVFEYYRGSGISALDNLEKSSGLKSPARFNRNQFGFDAGGPIIKDKTFIFGLFQRDIVRSGNTLGPSVRTLTPTGLNALSSVPLRPGQSTASRQAIVDSLKFLNDVYKLNPVFRDISNSTTVNGVPVQTGITNIPITQPFDAWELLVRGDHKLSENDNLTGRYAYSKPTSPNVTSNTQFGTIFAGDQSILNQNLALSETHVFKSNLLNEFRFSYIRSNLQFPERQPELPVATIGGLFTVGGATNFPQARVQNSFQWTDILSWQKGNHSFKFGADIRRIALFNQSTFDAKGSFNFDNLQQYMNNIAASYRQALQKADFDAKQTQQFYFIQDDFRVSPHLTLNLGLRYEYSKMPFGAFGATDKESLDTLVNGPLNSDKNNFGPAIGFAYSPHSQNGFLNKLFGDGKSSIRGGYRISYDVLFYNILVVSASNFPRVVVGETFNVTDVYPNRTTVTGGATFNALATYVNIPQNAKTPSAQSFSLSIQRDIQKSYVLEFGYAGSRGSNAINQLQANPSILTPEQSAAVRAARNSTVIPNTQLRRIFPLIGSRVLVATEAQSTYHSGFLSLNKRMSNGLQFGAAYTFSKNMSNNDESLAVGAITNGSPQVPQDFLNYKAEKSLSAFDRTHRFVINYIYEIPWLNSSWAQSPVVKHIFSGWQFSGVTQTQSGQPFTIVTGVDSNGNGAGGDRPNFIPGGTLTLDPNTGNLRTFTTSGMFFVPLGTNGLPLANSLGNGNLGKNTLRAPGFWNTDLSLAKKFKVLESRALILRVDLLNAFNQDNYGIPVNNMNNLGFGKNTNNWGNRSMTLGAKFTF